MKTRQAPAPYPAHAVHVELDLDRNIFSMCVAGQAVATDEPFLDSSFDELHSLQFIVPATITEAHPTEYIVDKIRITKE